MTADHLFGMGGPQIVKAGKCDTVVKLPQIDSILLEIN